MKKYLYGFKMYFLNSFNYRFNTVVSLVFGNIGILIEIKKRLARPGFIEAV